MGHAKAFAQLATVDRADTCLKGTETSGRQCNQRITFVGRKVEHELQALFAIDIDGTNLRRLTPYRLEVGVKHDWAPGCHRIVIIPSADHPRGLSLQVATIRPDGSHLRILTRAGAN
jgi:hypothetical protein